MKAMPFLAAGAVAWREFYSRRLVLVAGAAAGLIPLLLPLIHGLTGTDADEAREFAALFFYALLGLPFAVTLGSTLFSEGAPGRPLGFYAVRPVSGITLWVAKLAGGVGLLWAMGLAALLPSWMADGARPEMAGMPLAVIGTGAVIVALAVPATHAVVVLLRKPSLLLVADVPVVIATTWIISWAVQNTPFYYPPPYRGAFAEILQDTIYMYIQTPMRHTVLHVVLHVVVVVSGAFVVLVLASFVAVWRGRADAQVVHTQAAIAVPAGCVLLLAVLAMHISWVTAGTPAAFSRMSVDALHTSGSWVAIDGLNRGAPISLLANLETGRYIRPGKQEWYGGSGASWDGWTFFQGTYPDYVFSPSGALVVWTEWDARRQSAVLATVRLNEPEPAIERTSAPEIVPWASLTFSPIEDRLASITGSKVLILDASTGQEICEPIDDDRIQWTASTWVDNDHLRLYSRHNGSGRRGPDSDRIDLAEFNVNTCQLEWTGAIPDVQDLWWGSRVSAGGRVLAVKDHNRQRLRIHDGRTGELIATLAESKDRRAGQLVFLADGRIVTIARAQDGYAVKLHAESGELINEIAFPALTNLLAGCQAAAGQLIMVTFDDEQEEISWNSTVYLVDLDEGTTRPIAQNVYPVCRLYELRDPSTVPSPGSDAAWLFYGTEHRSVWRLDAGSGEMELMVGTEEGGGSADVDWAKLR